MEREGFSRAGTCAMVAIMAIATLVPMAARQDTYSTAGEWRQWGGPSRNFVSSAHGLADRWPDAGPPELWRRPLGPGHSAIVVDRGVLYTMYRPGQEGRGPWEAREAAIALDAATGRTLWEHTYPSEPANFRHGAGPHATPLVVDDLVFTAGTNKQIHALEKKTGRVAWQRDLVKDFGAPPTLVRPAVKAGYASSPLAYRDTIILQAGGPGQSVIALRQRDGALVWKSGDFLAAEAAPLLIDVDGQIQVVVVGGQSVNGLDPDTGRLLWSHPHDTDGDMNNSTPTWGPDNLLTVSSGYNQGTRALRLRRSDDATRVEEAWFTARLKLMFVNAVRLGDHLYGTHGDFGPAFLTALDVRTGDVAWQQRGFGRSNLLHADGKAIILDEDGHLVLARLSPAGAEVLGRTQIFATTSWTVPTLVGTTLYARDRATIVALNLGSS
jgi:outer membrane protein assembly factor BamB